jgi:hypothetical protein
VFSDTVACERNHALRAQPQLSQELFRGSLYSRCTCTPTAHVQVEVADSRTEPRRFPMRHEVREAGLSSNTYCSIRHLALLLFLFI